MQNLKSNSFITEHASEENNKESLNPTSAKFLLY